MLKKICILLLGLTLMACSSTKDRLQIIPAAFITKVKPVYPVTASAEGIEGWVWVNYTVTERGDVINAVISSSSHAGVCDQAALNAISQFKYRPRYVNGNPTSINGVTYRFDFEMR